MGYSHVAAAAIIGVSIFASVEAAVSDLVPIFTDIREAYYARVDRTYDQIQTDLKITNVSEVPWWDTDWNCRKKIIIDHDKVAEDLYNFPVLIDITDTDLRDTAQSDGDDICFVNMENTEKYNHQIEYYTGDTGHLIAWVNVTFLSGSTDTLLYMYYNNPGAPNQENPNGVWDDNFRGVWHLNDEGTTLSDSTSYGNDINSYSGDPQYNISGKIAGAASYDGDDFSYQNYDDNDLDFGTSDFSMEVWIKTTDNDGGIMGKMHSLLDTRYGYEMDILSNSVRGWIGDGSFHSLGPGSSIINDGNWHYIVFDFDRDAYCTYYIDGRQDSQKDISSYTGSIDSNAYFILGNYYSGINVYYTGELDEVHLSNVVRSSGWVNTTYVNQNSPSSFYSIGDEETKSQSHIKIVVNNTGMTTLELDDFTVLINGTKTDYICLNSYICPDFEAGFFVTANSDVKRVKVVSGNGISDYKLYGG